MPPHNMAMTLIGAAMLWFGWFGFNAGSALAANAAAGMAMALTQVSAVFGAAGWLACEKNGRTQTLYALGLASGAVSDAVSITPARKHCQTRRAAAAIGILTAAARALSVTVVKHKLRYDDSGPSTPRIRRAGGRAIDRHLFRQPHFRRGCTAVWQQLWIQVKDGVRYGGIQRADELGDFGRSWGKRQPARRQGCRTQRFGS